MSQFHVYVVHRLGSPATVDGRCLTGHIRLHDKFVVLAKIDNAGTESEPQAVSLDVTGITAYSHEFKEITEGLTARLCLKGNGLDLLQEGLVLCTERR